MVPTANHSPSDGSRGEADPRLGERTVAVLDSLRRHSAPVTLTELADEVGDHEPTRGDQFEAVTDPDPHRTQIRLHHVDLPVLSDAGYLEYHENDRLITPLGGQVRERPSLDVVFEVLAHPHRRAALDHLVQQRVSSVRELAAAVVNEGNTAVPGDRSTTDIDRVFQALYHRHLPKLHQAEVVDLDHERGLVTATEHVHWLHRVVRDAARSSQRFQRASR